MSRGAGIRPGLLGAMMVLGSAMFSATPAGLHAQDAPGQDDAPTCLRFTFGAWKPALDWKGAGHLGVPDSTQVGRTPEGRGWAAPTAYLALNGNAGARPPRCRMCGRGVE